MERHVVGADRVRATVREVYSTKGRIRRYYYAILSCGCTVSLSMMPLPLVGEERTCRQCTKRARGR